jgi:hypothetical protein
MRKLLLASALAILWASAASAQCIGVAGINSVPVPGLNCSQDSIAPSYGATSIGIVPGTTPTDIACLTGSATRTIRVKRIVISGTAGSAINIVAHVVKRNAADTGGTAATTIATGLPIAFALDSTFAAPTATLIAYTANPTINDTNWSSVLANIIQSATIFLPVTSTASPPESTQFEFWPGGTGVSPPVLRGVAQQICVALNTSGGAIAAPSSGAMTVSWLWTEQTQ